MAGEQTNLEKLVNLSTQDFLNKYDSAIEMLAEGMEFFDYLNKYPKEILNYYDFPDEYMKVIQTVEMAERAQFSEDELVNMLKNNEDITDIHIAVMAYANEHNFHNMPFYRSFSAIDNQLKHFDDEIAKNTKPDLIELLDEDIPKDFSKEQSETILSVYNRMDLLSKSYGKKYGHEFDNTFRENVFNYLSDFKVFSSDNSVEQIQGMSNYILTYLQKLEPSMLNSVELAQILEKVCDLMVDHEKFCYLSDYIPQKIDFKNCNCNREYLMGTAIESFMDEMEATMDKYYHDHSIEKIDKNISLKFLEDICNRIDISDVDINFICKNADYYNLLTANDLDFISTSELFCFLLDGESAEHALELCDALDDLCIDTIDGMNLYYQFKFAGFSDDLILECLNEDMDFLCGNELKVAYAEGFSKCEIEKCFAESAIEICQNRMAIEEKHELEGRPSIMNGLKDKSELVNLYKKDLKDSPIKEIEQDLD